MRYNKLMDSLIQHYEIFPKLAGGQLDPWLASKISAGVVEVDGCFFLPNRQVADVSAILERTIDRTGLECEANEIALNEYDISGGDEADVHLHILMQAFLFTFALFEMLQKYGEFVVMLEFSDDPIFDCVEIFPGSCDDLIFGCTIRFHKKREGESWLADDLEEYKMNALLVLE